MGMSEFDPAASDRRAWNAGRKVGAKRALKPRQVWAIRFFLDQHGRLRDRALFDLAIDSKLGVRHRTGRIARFVERSGNMLPVGLSGDTAVFGSMVSASLFPRTASPIGRSPATNVLLREGQRALP